MKHISVQETKVCLDEADPDLILLDCREPEELEIASIECARNIPMSEIMDRWTELNPEAEIIVFCHSGVRSQSVTAYLEEQGFERVRNMVGGIEAWSSEIDPQVPRY